MKYIISILVFASIYTVILLLCKVYNTTYFEILISPNPFFTFLVTLILVIVTWWYARLTESIADSSEKNLETVEGTMMHQVILKIQETYSSSEMGQAVRSLWDFYDECEKKALAENKEKKITDEKIREKTEEKMLKAYEAEFNQNAEKFYKLMGRKLTTINGEKFPIDSQRRKASYFFQYLYDKKSSEIQIFSPGLFSPFIFQLSPYKQWGNSVLYLLLEKKQDCRTKGSGR